MHKISKIRLLTLQYSVEGCVFTLLAVFIFVFLPLLKVQQQLRLKILMNDMI